MRMIVRLAGVVLMIVAGATPAAAETWRTATASDIFAPRPKPVTFADEGVTVTIAPEPPDAESDVAIVVQFPGIAPYRVPTDEYRESIYGLSVGIGRLAPSDPAPTVLIGGYSGGAHCCATLQAVSLVEGQPVSTVLPRKDGAPVGGFPDDIDGDEVRDIRWQDDSLLYAFTSYAASWPVLRIYNLRGGELVDVSRRPGFASLYRDHARETLAECRAKQGGENAGACAAYAYAMAIQGNPEEGIRTATELATRPGWSPSRCAAEFDAELCAERREYQGFETALRQMMRENGYLP